MPAPSADLSTTRYGRRTTPRRVWVVVAVILIAAGTAWAWWASQSISQTPVSGEVHSFDVRSDHATEVTLEVRRTDPGARASCEVSAKAMDHTVVGERTVEIGPAEDDTKTVSSLIRTTRRAVNVDVDGCKMSD